MLLIVVVISASAATPFTPPETDKDTSNSSSLRTVFEEDAELAKPDSRPYSFVCSVSMSLIQESPSHQSLYMPSVKPTSLTCARGGSSFLPFPARMPGEPSIVHTAPS